MLHGHTQRRGFIPIDLQADLGELGKGVSFEIDRLTREAGAMSQELTGWPKAEIADAAQKLATLATLLAPDNPTMSPTMRTAAEAARGALGLGAGG